MEVNVEEQIVRSAKLWQSSGDALDKLPSSYSDKEGVHEAERQRLSRERRRAEEMLLNLARLLPDVTP